MMPRYSSLCTLIATLLWAGSLQAQDPGVSGSLTIAAADYDFGDTAFTPGALSTRTLPAWQARDLRHGIQRGRRVAVRAT
jgi:hypothetical protein